MLEDLEDGTITFYTQGNFTDLCRGPHIPDTGFIKSIKLLSIAGAYWRGDEKNKQLTRIYGITFPKQSELVAYLEKLEEAKRRDHRKLGKELDLFTFSAKVGQGLPLWLPKGAALRERLENFLKKAQRKAGYQQVITPHIGNKELYVCSGHYEKYGELHGLTRVRSFTQDDAHIFCTQEQVKNEFKNVIDIVLYVLKTLDFQNFTAQISLRDKEKSEKYIGSDENWAKAEQAIIEAAAEKNLDTVVAYGEAAFYGPKLDFMVQDALGREWQLGTIQVDYNLPERFELEYVGADNQKHRPVMIHRAPFGSMERFVAVLLEHCAGDFPLWLASDQFIILPVSEKYNDYAKKVSEFLNNSDIRGLVDDRNEKVGKKIRDAELAKVPFMLIVGEEEVEANTISVRQRGKGDLGKMPYEDFVTLVQNEIEMQLSMNS